MRPDGTLQNESYNSYFFYVPGLKVNICCPKMDSSEENRKLKNLAEQMVRSVITECVKGATTIQSLKWEEDPRLQIHGYRVTAKVEYPSVEEATLIVRYHLPVLAEESVKWSVPFTNRQEAFIQWVYGTQSGKMDAPINLPHVYERIVVMRADELDPFADALVVSAFRIFCAGVDAANAFAASPPKL